MQRPKTSKGKKSVGFSLTGTKIDPPEESLALQGTKSRMVPRKVNYNVSKAHEYESFRNIPKYSHASLAVIHPPARRVVRTAWQPDRKLAFDGEPLQLGAKRFEPKNIPEHLARPQIDEETMIRMKAAQSTKAIAAETKKMSLGAQKEYKAEEKRKNDIKIKIRKAERNLTKFFTTLKKILDCNEQDLVHKDCPETTVQQALYAETMSKYCRFLYTCFYAARHQGGQMSPSAHLAIEENRIGANEFAAFLKFFDKDLGESLSMDIFMLLNKRLAAMLVGPKPSEFESDPMTGSPGFRNRDLQGMTRQEELKQYGMTQREISSMTLDLALLDAEYKKFASNDDSMSDLINLKITKARNVDFRLKLDSWKTMANTRKTLKNRAFEHGKALRKQFEESQNLFTMDKHRILQCISQYDALCDDKAKHAKEQKAINNFLSQLPEASHSTLELADLDRLLKNELSKHLAKSQMLYEFVASVKQECVINQNFFIFFDIPDLIVKKKYARKDYEDIIKIVQKVKTRYLAEKAKMMPDKPLNTVAILTDDDLAPLELFDFVLTQFEYKNKERRDTIQHFLSECNQQVAKQSKGGGQSYSEKTKKNIEQGALIEFLNRRMEQRAEVYFANNYKHRNLYQVFVRQQASNSDGFRSAKQFEDTFNEVMKPNLSTNKYYNDYRQKLEKEIQKFNGKLQVGEGTETNSEATTATKNTRKSGASGSPGRRAGSPGLDDVDEAGNLQTATINDRDPNFTGGLRLQAVEGDEYDRNALDEEELADEEAMNAEQKRREESPLKKLFRDENGEFDPKKKFGIIEDGALLYDNVTTSYPVNLPTDYYQRYINQQMPTKEHGNGKWFIRPHHLETLTKHPLSVKDDVLNTRYISHYDQNYGKKEEVNINADAIENIENHLAQLKQRMTSMQIQKGEDLEFMEELSDQMRLEGRSAYEKFVNDKTRHESKKLIIEAYEGMLGERRAVERSVLNNRRFKEYEKNRPPQAKWYELKGAEFSKELFRNRMALKPNDSNAVYLKTLQDQSLY